MPSCLLSIRPWTAILLAVIARQAGAAALSGLAADYRLYGPVVRGDQVMLMSRVAVTAFVVDSRRWYHDRTLLYLNGPLASRGGGFAVTTADAEGVVRPLLDSVSALQGVGNRIIVLDPGHGGRDAGALGGRRVPEKKLTLDIALRVRDKLRRSQVSVVLTRERDEDVSLAERTLRARRAHADVFVSIHLNSGRPTARGMETFVMPAPGFPATHGTRPDPQRYAGNRYPAASTLLGYALQRGLTTSTPGEIDRGVKRARYLVLKDSPCPAALVECGFLSCPADELRLLSRTYRDTVAEGLARGLLTYISRIDETHVVLDSRW